MARRILSFVIPLCLFPALVAFGVCFLGDRKYVFISLMGAVLTLLLSLFGLPWVSAMYIRSAQQLQISAGMMDETPEHRDCR